MITKSIGLLRNIVNKRQQLMGIFKTIIHADNALIITMQDKQLSVSGFTDDDATSLFMLGTATGYCIGQTAKQQPDINISEYLMQPSIVATGYLEKQGLLK